MCRLALAVGRSDLQAFAAELDERDYQTWQQYYDDEPWDARLHAAQIAQAVDSSAIAMVSAIARLPPGTIELKPLSDYMVRACP